MIGILLVLMVALAACSGEADTATEATALPQSIQLSVGTLMLEETPQAVTAEQAQELLPLWQMLRTLQQSDSAAQAEIEAVLNQIQKVMTPEQLAAIEGMDLTLASMRTMAQELGLGIGGGEGSSGGQEGRFRPPDGMIPGGGMVPGGGMPGGGTDLSSEEQATAIAERMSSGFGTALMDRLIELLESRAGVSEVSAVASKARPEATASPSVEANNEAKVVPMRRSEPVEGQNAEPSPPTGGIVTETLVAETLTPTATSQPSNFPISPSPDAGAEVPVPPSSTPTPTPLPGSEDLAESENELTGKLVFQTSNGGDIYVINADGTGPRRLTDGMEPAWSPDGTRVAFTRWQDPRGLYVIDEDGSNETLVFGWVAAKGAAWSPDGSRIAFTRWYGGQDEDTEVCFHGRCRTLPADHWWKLGVVRLEDGYFHDLRCYPHSLSPTWSPDGSVIAYDSDFGIHLTNEEGTIGDVTDDRSLFAVSTDGRDITPVWSPDGSKIAFGFNQHDHWEIYVMDADGSNRVRLTQEEPLAERPPNNVSPAWSPDGQHIVFFTDRNGKWELWVMDADGSNQRPMFETAPSTSPFDPAQDKLRTGLDGLEFEYGFVAERMISWAE
jgi:TolB protein